MMATVISFCNGAYSFFSFHFIRILYSPGGVGVILNCLSIENTLRSSRVQNCAFSRNCGHRHANEIAELLSHLPDGQKTSLERKVKLA